MPNIPMLAAEQEELLVVMVEGARNVPKDARQKFVVSETSKGDFLIHPGLSSRPLIYMGDLEELERQGLVSFSRYGRSLNVDVCAAGYRHYEIIKGRNWRVAERVEDEARKLLSSHEFQARHVEAFRKWSNAEALLWSADKPEVFTQIGHLCREAMQAFVTTLVEKYRPVAVDPDRAHTKARLRAVLASQSPRLPSTPVALVEAMISYWEAVADLTQRQEHGAQREAQELVWEDARRVIFQTLVTMYEIDRLLS